MSEPACVKPSGTGQSCLHALAAGWIHANDLCPVCAARFMAALDGIHGPLDWHANYRQRAACHAAIHAKPDDARP